MPRFKPEDGSSTVLEKPTPGSYLMRIAESVDFKDADGNWEATLTNFYTIDNSKTIADRVTPRTVWKFRRLAEAIGQEGIDAYETKDAAGFSRFDPADFQGRTVKVTVEQYEWEGKTGVRVERVEKPEGEVYELHKVDEDTDPTEHDHATVKDEESDIPF